MNQVELRYNGKFFTMPYEAPNAGKAFDYLLEDLGNMGVIKSEQADRIKKRGYKNSLRPAKIPIMNFMWDRIVAAEENEMKVVFSLYDTAGWRFFGRI